MIWLALIFTAYLTLELAKLWKQKMWRELSVNVGLAVMGLVMATLVQWHVWLRFDALAPIRVVFMPASKWLYNGL